MINRIRDIRRSKGMTLADVAARCDPPTTAQTIGRLETGMRNLSLVWMNRIAAALDVAPELLVRSENAADTKIIARLTETGAEPLASPRDAIMPASLAGEGRFVVLAAEAGHGEYRAGDQVWLREVAAEDFPRLLNRDVLARKPGGRFGFGRMLDHGEDRITLLPPGSGQRQIVIEGPDWLAVAEMLVRKL